MRSCVRCAAPTRSSLPVCTRPGCITIYSRIKMRGYHGSDPRPRKYPCRQCGLPTFTRYGYCTRTRVCRNLHKEARRRWILQAVRAGVPGYKVMLNRMRRSRVKSTRKWRQRLREGG